jgi:hypothetical protein
MAIGNAAQKLDTTEIGQQDVTKANPRFIKVSSHTIIYGCYWNISAIDADAPLVEINNYGHYYDHTYHGFGWQSAPINIPQRRERNVFGGTRH